jgi:hypothetical protein
MALASAVNFGFGSRRKQWPYIYSFQDLAFTTRRGTVSLLSAIPPLLEVLKSDSSVVRLVLVFASTVNPGLNLLEIHDQDFWYVFRNGASPKPSEGGSAIKFLLFTTLSSLSGLPPFIGFLPKWTVIQLLIINNLRFIIAVMVVTSLAKLYFYLRLSYSRFIILIFCAGAMFVALQFQHQYIRAVTVCKYPL